VRAVTFNCDRKHKKVARLRLILLYKKARRAPHFSAFHAREFSQRMAPMFSEITNAMFDGKGSRPLIMSYDSVYEHSFEHYAEVRQLVEDAHAELMKAAHETEETIAALIS
jgi:hypothetical protein